MNKGFTLVEIMISLSILVLIGALGLIVSMDFYRGYDFNYEQNLVVSILQRARSQAMANINQTQHGVCIIGSSYVLSNGTTCTTGDTFPKAAAITVTSSVDGTSWTTPVIFNQLDGKVTTPVSITVSGQGKTSTITINSEGRIDW